MKLHTIPNQMHTQRITRADGTSFSVAVVSRDRETLAMYPAPLSSLQLPTMREVQADAHWRVTPTFYIRMNGAFPGYHYWSQRAQNWTTRGAHATIFSTREEAEAEAIYADAYGPGEAEVVERNAA